MSADCPAEGARFYRPCFLPGVELVSVAYTDRRFPEHSHDEYVIGAVTAGAETLTAGRSQHVADVGTVLLLNPAEAHANATIGTDTLRYSVLYVPKGTVGSFLGPEAVLPQFSSPVSKQADLFRQVLAVHAALACTGSCKLEQESALSLLVQALEPHGLTDKHDSAASHDATGEIRQYIDDHSSDMFGLADLSALSGLSKFHLVRIFKKMHGLSPLAYRDQVRMAKARRLLIAGHPIAQLSLTLGYADQSHFTRQFQRIVGTSPQRYARAINR